MEGCRFIWNKLTLKINNQVSWLMYWGAINPWPFKLYLKWAFPCHVICKNLNGHFLIFKISCFRTLKYKTKLVKCSCIYLCGQIIFWSAIFTYILRHLMGLFRVHGPRACLSTRKSPLEGRTLNLWVGQFH